MLEQFQIHIRTTFPFLEGKKILLAVSGGIDSMVLWNLCEKAGFSLAVAHCNFQLRGEESNGDMEFVAEIAAEKGIACFMTTFDTEHFARDYHLSVQMAARALRYKWFQELLEQEQFDYVMTAHHADDNLETFIINLSRGTGIEGLTGIPEQHEQVIRPLLPFGRNEIERYAKQENISWREDSSNESTKYLRNKIRHHIIPELKELNPDILSSLSQTQQYLSDTMLMAKDAAILVYKQVAQEHENAVHFNLKKLKQLSNYQSYLYYWLKDYGFSDWTAVEQLTNTQSGKEVYGISFRLLKDREKLILYPVEDKDNTSYWVAQNQSEVKVPLKIEISPATDISSTANSTIFVDRESLSFPLEIRKWRAGDHFFPLGMEGHSKKVSKLLKDEKLSLLEKEAVWVLCSESRIVWVIGLRADERFKVRAETKNIIKMSLVK